MCAIVSCSEKFLWIFLRIPLVSFGFLWIFRCFFHARAIFRLRGAGKRIDVTATKTAKQNTFSRVVCYVLPTFVAFP